MKILVFSDSHGDLEIMKKVIGWERPDYVFHLGGRVIDAESLCEQLPDLPLVWTYGHRDYGWPLHEKRKEVVTAEGVRFMLYPTYEFSPEMIALPRIYASLKRECDVLLTARDEKPLKKEICDLRILNPGACGRGRRPSYGYFVLEHGKPTDWGIRYLK